MIGLLIGGIIWGIMGDKKGRLSVLVWLHHAVFSGKFRSPVL